MLPVTATTTGGVGQNNDVAEYFIDYEGDESAVWIMAEQTRFELVVRAMAAYSRDVFSGKYGSADVYDYDQHPGIPSDGYSYIAGDEATRRSYVVLADATGKLLAVYRITYRRKPGSKIVVPFIPKLKRLRRYPASVVDALPDSGAGSDPRPKAATADDLRETIKGTVDFVRRERAMGASFISEEEDENPRGAIRN